MRGSSGGHDTVLDSVEDPHRTGSSERPRGPPRSHISRGNITPRRSTGRFVCEDDRKFYCYRAVQTILRYVQYPSTGRLCAGGSVKSNLDLSRCLSSRLRRFQSPLGIGKARLGVPGGEVVFALEDQVWRHYKTVATNALDRCSLFPTAWLKNLASALSISTRNDHTAADPC